MYKIMNREWMTVNLINNNLSESHFNLNSTYNEYGLNVGGPAKSYVKNEK